MIELVGAMVELAVQAFLGLLQLTMMVIAAIGGLVSMVFDRVSGTPGRARAGSDETTPPGASGGP